MSFWDDVSKFLGTDRSDSFIGHVGEVLAHDNLASAAATAVAAYFGLPYVPGGSELAAYASELANAAPTAVGPGGITAGNALVQAGTTAADLGTVASGAATTGVGALTPAALESAAGTAGYGVNAAAQAAGFDAAGSGAYLNNLGATIPSAAGTAAAGATPWYQTPTALQAGAGLIGGLAQSASQRQAAAAQADAAQRGLDLQKSIYEQQSTLNQPFYQAGVTGQNRLMDLLGLGSNTTGADYGKYAKDFSMSDFQADPGYAFRLSEGQKALERSAAARGGLIYGGAMKAATRYGQDMASQEYQNAFNRYQTNRANQLQPLGSLQNVGQSAANQQSGALGNYGVNAGNLLNQQGTAYAAGNLGTGNTINNMIGAGISAYQNNSLVDQLRRLNPSIYTG
jgi:hypothetical protein